jgi:hypothetical protein
MRKFLVLFSAVASLAVFNFSAAYAQYCEGTVHGLSGRYNPRTGSGFLAVRAGPKASAICTTIAGIDLRQGLYKSIL